MPITPRPIGTSQHPKLASNSSTYTPQSDRIGRLGQLVGTLKEAGRYYPNTAPPMTLAEEIRSSLNEAIKAKNEAKFDQAFDEMSAGCNRCHGAADRAFIVIRRPSYPSAFSNQQYSPRPSERR